MTPSKSPPRPAIAGTFAMLVALALVALAPAASGQPSTQAPGDSAALYAETFDAHWEALQEDYPYFEMYGVDWEQERADHRPRAIAAGNDDEFAWELARLFSALPDPHLSFIPSLATIAGRWSYPELDTHIIGRRIYVTAWPEEEQAGVPPAFADDPHACPEIIAVRGELPTGTSQILAAGPLGTTCDISLRWPDGTETEHALRRPDESNLPPPDKHYGDRWLVTGRVGSIGYLRVKTFSPEKATLGPDGKMTTMLRAALVELGDTDGLVLDLQGNGGGMVAASDPFLGNFLERSIGYRWGNSGGKRRVIMPRTPRYEGEVVALVDERSASGGEWAARILRDAGRATVVGEPTSGAEAAVHESKGPDGSMVAYSAWPMVEPGRTPFQGTGIELDHALPLTIEDVRARGYEEAMARVPRARFAKALELLGAPASDLDAFVALADEADRPADEVVTRTR
ncbi:MAG: S41 family peptidase [Planctomycetota bacterium]